MAKKVTIVDVRRLPSPDPKRLGKYDRMISYHTDTGQVGAVFVPDESYTDAAAQAAIKADLLARGTLPGTTFEV